MTDFTIFQTDVPISKINIIQYFKDHYWLLLLISIFIFSFMLDIYVLTRYSLSYGIDGAFYDIQVRNILQHGFPMSNDPPLAYYLLTPFVVLSGNSFLGVKIGMALMGSLLVFPAFLLTECYNNKVKGSKIPALLSAFMVTVNVNYFALLGDYLQNLVGVLVLSVFLYFMVRWFEDISHWKRYGVLTVIFLCINLLTHIYTGAVAVTLFFTLLIFSIVFKTFKTHKLPVFDLKIFGILSVLVITFFMVLFLTYPVMYTKFGTVLSYINSSTTTDGGMGMGMASTLSGIIFLSLPYLLGIGATLIILYRGLKEKIIPISSMTSVSPRTSTSSGVPSSTENLTSSRVMTSFVASNSSRTSISSLMNKNTLLAWVYISLAILLGVLVMMPASDYQSRFMLISFLPIGLLVPLGLKFLETEFLAKYSRKTPNLKTPVTILVAGIALIFAFSCFYTASESFNSLEPTITSDEYQELLEIKASFANITNENIVIVASDFQDKYWVEYVLGDVGVGNNVIVLENVQGVQENYQNSTIYSVSAQSNQTSSDGFGKVSSNPSKTPGSGADNSYSFSFLLPYGPSILPNSLDMLSTVNNGSQTRMSSMQKDHQPSGVMANSTNGPENMNSSSGRPTGNIPSNITKNLPSNLTNHMLAPENMTNPVNTPPGVGGNSQNDGSNGPTRQVVDSLTSSGTTVFSGNYFKIIRIDLSSYSS